MAGLNRSCVPPRAQMAPAARLFHTNTRNTAGRDGNLRLETDCRRPSGGMDRSLVHARNRRGWGEMPCASPKAGINARKRCPPVGQTHPP